MMSRSTRIAAALALLLLTGSAQTARSSIVTMTGAIDLATPPPASVQLGAMQSNTAITTFVEQQGLTLTSNVKVDDAASGTFTSNASLISGIILSGTKVDSYFLSTDPVNSPKTYDGSVTFSTAILGVFVLSASLDSSDATFGASGTKYPFGLNDRGLELATDQDTFTISADHKTLTLHALTKNAVDEVRIVTASSAVPEPASLALFGLGGLGLAGLTRVRNRRGC